MNLSEFIKKYKNDDNVFWMLELGEIQNLLEEAIEIIEKRPMELNERRF
jgi:hypothetical protein